MTSSLHSKIKSLSQISLITQRLKTQGKKIVQCHGVFDLVHPGHIRHFASAKKEGDVLVVTITKDKHVKRGPGRPIFNEQLRAETLASLVAIDYVCTVDFPTAVEAIKAVCPNFYAKGPDYKDRKKDVTGKIYDEERALASVGGKIVFTDDVTFSSSSLINTYLEVYSDDTRKYLKKIAKKYELEEVLRQLDLALNQKVLVIGDAIIDQYHFCRPMNKSSKEPIVVNQYLSEETFAGGSLATACHSAQVVERARLLTVLGEDPSFERFIRSKLSKNISPKFYFRPDAQTTVKRRFLGDDTKQKFFEVCYMDDSELPKSKEDQIIKFLNNEIKHYDIVIVNDFGHGMLTPKIINTVCSKAKKIALNVQTNSANMGFNMVTKYKRANLVCIDELELRLAMHDKTTDLKLLTKKLKQQMKCDQIIVTRGRDGSLAMSADNKIHFAPALSHLVVDKVGAGDAFFAYIAPLYASGMKQDLISFIGNAVGSLAVQIVGNRGPVKKVDLIKFITRLMKF